MKQSRSVSVSRGETAHRHDGREYIPKNAEVSFQKHNVDLLRCEDVGQRVNDFFRPAVQRYNDKQKRADRKKSEDYYQALLSGEEGYGKGKAQESPIYEYVFQIGNRDDTGVTDDSFDADHWKELKEAGKLKEASQYAEAHRNTSPDKAVLKEALLAVGQKFANGECGSNFLPLYAYCHDDEPNGTCHLHVAFCPYVTGEKTGLDTRVSLRKALKAMGYPGDAQEGIFAWQRDMKDMITKEMEKRGYQREIKDNEAKHIPVDEFKAQKRKAELQADIDRYQAAAQDELRKFIMRKQQADEEKARLARLEAAGADLQAQVGKGTEMADRALKRLKTASTAISDNPISDAEIVAAAKKATLGSGMTVYERLERACRSKRQKEAETLKEQTARIEQAKEKVKPLSKRISVAEDSRFQTTLGSIIKQDQQEDYLY